MQGPAEPSPRSKSTFTTEQYTSRDTEPVFSMGLEVELSRRFVGGQPAPAALSLSAARLRLYPPVGSFSTDPGLPLEPDTAGATSYPVSLAHSPVLRGRMANTSH